MDERHIGNIEYAVHTSKLCRVFGSLRAVDDLDLRVEPGTLYGFLGRNGAGKSTTIKMLTGILAPSSGSITLLGVNPEDEAQAADVRRRIGVVPEDLALFELLTGREYLNFVGTIYLLDEAMAQERVEELFEVLNVGATEKQLVLEYSHGMRKKLALAAALIGDPALLFLDEPFEGVDAVSARVMRDILVRFVDRGGTVFITSHVLDVIERLCSHAPVVDLPRVIDGEQTSTWNHRGGLRHGSHALCSFGPIVFVSNVFGWDRGGFRVLLATGPPRHLVLLGKNLGLMPITLGPGLAVLVAAQLLWPQPTTHFLASILQLMAVCLVLFMMGNHFSITGPWAASFMSLKQRGEAMASNLGASLVAAFAVGVIMLATAGVLVLERLVGDAGWPIPLYLLFSVLTLGLAAPWYRDALRYQAKALPAQEERILEAINTPVD